MSDEPIHVRRTVLTLPNGLTLANLFFGIFAIVAASRNEYERAAWYIVWGAVCDSLDGRVARATRTGSRFGEELDSLVDALSFGLAPSLMMYFAVLSHVGWEWMLVFFYVACAVIRLARFNIEQAGRKKTHFVGLPSPAAGMTLATYYWFSNTPLYNQTFLGALPWQTLLKFLMAGLAFLMISNIPYPAWPTFSMRSWRGFVALVAFIALIAGLVALPKEFVFPVSVAYVLYGPVRAVVLGLLDRGEDEEPRPSDAAVVHLSSTRHARRARGRGGPPPRPQSPERHPE